MEGVLKGVNQDVDESFQKYRLNASNMVPLAKDMNSNFQGMVNHSESKHYVKILNNSFNKLANT